MTSYYERIIDAVIAFIGIMLHLLGRSDRTKILSIIGANVVATFIVLVPYMGTIGSILLSILGTMTFVASLMLIEHFINRPLM